MKEIIIVGADVIGLLAAIGLRAKGHKVTIIEQPKKNEVITVVPELIKMFSDAIKQTIKVPEPCTLAQLEHALSTIATKKNITILPSKFQRFTDNQMELQNKNGKTTTISTKNCLVLDSTEESRSVVNSVNDCLGRPYFKAAPIGNKVHKDYVKAMFKVSNENYQLLVSQLEKPNTNEFILVREQEHLRKLGWKEFSKPPRSLYGIDVDGNTALGYSIPPEGLASEQQEEYFKALLLLYTGKKINILPPSPELSGPRFTTRHIDTPQYIQTKTFKGNEKLPAVIPIGQAHMQYDPQYVATVSIKPLLDINNVLINACNRQNKGGFNFNFDQFDKNATQTTQEYRDLLATAYDMSAEEMKTDLPDQLALYKKVLAQSSEDDSEDNSKYLSNKDKDDLRSSIQEMELTIQAHKIMDLAIKNYHNRNKTMVGNQNYEVISSQEVVDYTLLKNVKDLMFRALEKLPSTRVRDYNNFIKQLEKLKNVASDSEYNLKGSNKDPEKEAYIRLCIEINEKLPHVSIQDKLSLHYRLLEIVKHKGDLSKTLSLADHMEELCKLDSNAEYSKRAVNIIKTTKILALIDNYKSQYKKSTEEELDSMRENIENIYAEIDVKNLDDNLKKGLSKKINSFHKIIKDKQAPPAEKNSSSSESPKNKREPYHPQKRKKSEPTEQPIETHLPKGGDLDMSKQILSGKLTALEKTLNDTITRCNQIGLEFQTAVKASAEMATDYQQSADKNINLNAPPHAESTLKLAKQVSDAIQAKGDMITKSAQRVVEELFALQPKLKELKTKFQSDNIDLDKVKQLEQRAAQLNESLQKVVGDYENLVKILGKIVEVIDNLADTLSSVGVANNVPRLPPTTDYKQDGNSNSNNNEPFEDGSPFYIPEPPIETLAEPVTIAALENAPDDNATLSQPEILEREIKVMRVSEQNYKDYIKEKESFFSPAEAILPFHKRSHHVPMTPEQITNHLRRELLELSTRIKKQKSDGPDEMNPNVFHRSLSYNIAKMFVILWELDFRLHGEPKDLASAEFKKWRNKFAHLTNALSLKELQDFAEEINNAYINPLFERAKVGTLSTEEILKNFPKTHAMKKIYDNITLQSQARAFSPRSFPECLGTFERALKEFKDISRVIPPNSPFEFQKRPDERDALKMLLAEMGDCLQELEARQHEDDGAVWKHLLAQNKDNLIPSIIMARNKIFHHPYQDVHVGILSQLNAKIQDWNVNVRMKPTDSKKPAP